MEPLATSSTTEAKVSKVWPGKGLPLRCSILGAAQAVALLGFLASLRAGGGEVLRDRNFVGRSAEALLLQKSYHCQRSLGDAKLLTKKSNNTINHWICRYHKVQLATVPAWFSHCS